MYTSKLSTYNDTKRMDFSCTWKENRKNDRAQLTLKKKKKRVKHDLTT